MFQLVASSPYLSRQHAYNDRIPESHYRSVVNETGCVVSSRSAFECLVELDVVTLANIGNTVSGANIPYDWGFVPVTDGVILRDVPSRQLSLKQVNGRRILVGVSPNS